jgi:tol-pal system protein YbgF
MKYYAIVLFTLFATLGCASTQEVGQIRGDVTSVYGELRGYKEKMDTRMAKVEKQLATTDEALRKQLVDLSIGIESREDTIKKILGRLEELESQLKAYWDETKGQLRDLKRISPGDHVSEDKTSERPVRVGPEEFYKEAFEGFRKGRHEEALHKFSEFVKHYPDSPLVASARYWMGESAMNLKDYEKAIVYFQEVVDNYPKSDKAAKALLRQADAFAATGDKKTSTILLKRIVEVYPKSEEARLAERSLRGGPH